MRRKKILPNTLTVQEKETLNEKKQGLIEMANWLERQLKKEIYELETMSNEKLLTLPIDDLYLAQTKYRFFYHYLNQIKHIKEQIEK